MFSASLKAQWEYKTVDNSIDNPYKIAFCKDTLERGLLKMERFNGEVILYLQGSYFCAESLTVDVSLNVNNELKKYVFRVGNSGKKNVLFLADPMTKKKHTEFLEDFKKSTFMSVRVNEYYCDNSYFAFDMKNALEAYEFMSGIKPIEKTPVESN